MTAPRLRCDGCQGVQADPMFFSQRAHLGTLGVGRTAHSQNVVYANS